MNFDGDTNVQTITVGVVLLCFVRNSDKKELALLNSKAFCKNKDK